MMKRYYVQTNAYNFVAFTDNKKAVVINESAFDKPLTFEVAKTADYSNFDGYKTSTIKELAANYNGNICDWQPDEYENTIEF